MRGIQGIYCPRESHDEGKFLIASALFEYGRIAINLFFCLFQRGLRCRPLPITGLVRPLSWYGSLILQPEAQYRSG